MAPQSDRKILTHDDYLIGWICPLEVEQIAATLMLDTRHATLSQPETDHNVYTLGSIHGHNIVIAGLPIASNNAAAVVVTQMRTTFPCMKFGLLVGIGGGVPISTDEGPIRLGHVVVNKPNGENSGAVQYDHGKARAGTFERTGSLMSPPMLLLSAVQTMAVALALTSVEEDPLLKNIRRIDAKARKLQRFKFPGRENDRLFEASYTHKTPKVSCAKSKCDPNKIINRKEDDGFEEIQDPIGEEIVIHRGTIGSGELVLKDAILRDELADQYGLLCFETEAAGALTDFPCLVIRGISDYCDTHKNDDWHGYAAAAAAAYARNLFSYIPIAKVKSLSISIEDMQSMKSGIDDIRDNQRKIQLEAWLRAPDPSSNYNEASNLRQIGTGSWLTNGIPFSNWKVKPGSLLWLIGKAGSGKTILNSSVVEALHDTQSDNGVLIYFYFDFRDTGKQSFSGMTRSLVYQLSSKSKLVEAEISRCFEDHGNGRNQPSDTDVEDILTKALSLLECVWIVIDALDECQTRREILVWLTRTASQRAKSLHIFVTSRNEEDIREKLQPITLSGEIIDLQHDFNHEDISLYIGSRLYEGDDFARWKNRRYILEMIEKTLTKRADQMFRWVACQLDTLMVCIDREQLEDELENMPQTLDETYERMIRNIHAANRRKAITLLQILVVSDRPLLLEEAVDVVATNPEKASFDPENRMPRPRDIAFLCPNLISVTGMSAADDVTHDSDFEDDVCSNSSSEDSSPEIIFTVALSHFSVKNYLQSERLDTDIKLNFATGNIEKMIAKTCLSYLINVKAKPDFNAIMATFPWSRQAAEYWYRYANQADNDVSLQNVTERFFATESVYNNWLAVFDPESPRSVKPYITSEDRPSPFYYVSLSGMMNCAEKFIEEGADINAQGGFYGSALKAASVGGYKDLVELLLSKGANINARSDRHGTALESASTRGFKGIVELLLSKGADINIKGRYGSTALLEALRYDYKDIAELLLSKGADVNAQSNYGRTALHLASAHGHKDIVELLLSKGADINAQDNNGSTALHKASAFGHKDIVEFLLSKGADINAQQDDEESTALDIALAYGHKDILALLLSKGGGFFNPRVTHEDIVKLLLDA